MFNSLNNKIYSKFTTQNVVNLLYRIELARYTISQIFVIGYKEEFLQYFFT